MHDVLCAREGGIDSVRKEWNGEMGRESKGKYKRGLIDVDKA